MKKLMILGGSRYIVPVIETAHKLGLKVITCDFLPDNVAHKYSDQYCNVSIIDKEETLRVAEKLEIDGIISFACDPGVVTAAYIAEKMKLPFQCSYQSVDILQDKGKFREFLEVNGFNVPHAKRYVDKKKPFEELDYFTWPVIVKPTDSAGSKGVSRVEKPGLLSEAIENAIHNSHNGAFIIEDFITFDGYHSSADIFTVDGKLEYVTYSDQLFDNEAENPYTPAMIIWPSSMNNEKQEELTRETQRLMNLLEMRTGIYNVETCVGINGKPYIMEVSPRGGGCKIAEIEQMAFGVNLIENEIRKAVNLPLIPLVSRPCNGCWCEMVLHDNITEDEVFINYDIKKEVKDKFIKNIDIQVKSGDIISSFSGANKSLGDVFFQFENREQLNYIMGNKNEWEKIEKRSTVRN